MTNLRQPYLLSIARRFWRTQFFASGVIVLVALLSFILENNCPAQDTNISTKPAIAAGSTNVDLLDDKYRLVIGDQLSFRIVEDEEDPKILTVTDSGEIQVPYLGRYSAVGKTCKDLAAGLKVELEKKYYLHATVVVAVDSKPRTRGKIYLVGAIRAPGPQDISSEETLTVSKAILRAGGFSDFANERKVKVTRATGPGKDDKQTFIVDVQRIFENGDTTSDLTLQPGDLIFVPERLIRF
jgi:protein involved in polysaccharide export with SLBB domain